MTRVVKLRARADEGFGLVELMIALVILNVGVLAVVAAFSVGRLTLRRAAETQTAAALADKQMELYRAVRYVDIYLDTRSVTTAYAELDLHRATWRTPALAGDGDVLAGHDACNADADGHGSATPDNRSYRIDTFIDIADAGERPQPSSASPSSCGGRVRCRRSRG